MICPDISERLDQHPCLSVVFRQEWGKLIILSIKILVSLVEVDHRAEWGR